MICHALGSHGGGTWCGRRVMSGLRGRNWPKSTIRIPRRARRSHACHDLARAGSSMTSDATRHEDTKTFFIAVVAARRSSRAGRSVRLQADRDPARDATKTRTTRRCFLLGRRGASLVARVVNRVRLKPDTTEGSKGIGRAKTIATSHHATARLAGRVQHTSNRRITWRIFLSVSRREDAARGGDVWKSADPNGTEMCSTISAIPAKEQRHCRPMGARRVACSRSIVAAPRPRRDGFRRKYRGCAPRSRCRCRV